MNPLKIFVLFVISIILFTGCSSKIEQKTNISKANFKTMNWDDLNGFETDNLTKALKVFSKDCLASKKDDRLKDVCLKAEDPMNIENPKDFFKNNFKPYQLISDEDDKTGLITGYYEPLLQGSYTQTKRFQYPIYSIPSNLITVELSKAYPSLSDYTLRGKLEGNKIVPYETREELANIDHETTKSLTPICFVDDKIDLFFLQIQGSGKVQLQNGKFINVGYGAQNGHQYYSIGRKLIEIGAITKENISLQSIKKWLLEHPSRVDEILNLNKSYIFFHNSKKTATGSLGTQLTANRNIAVDRRNIPLGFPVFISTTNPITEEPINQLMVAADTGGAIKGKIRADLFFGNGDKARELAGKMKQDGKLYILLPNQEKVNKD
ncbi:MAG: membrane-bound lytic murein transglycosylase A [Arcobacteraceae bacterium]|jgi:membrane-bound lytic murein transglycosylase A